MKVTVAPTFMVRMHDGTPHLHVVRGSEVVPLLAVEIDPELAGGVKICAGNRMLICGHRAFEECDCEELNRVERISR